MDKEEKMIDNMKMFSKKRHSTDFDVSIFIHKMIEGK